MIKFTIELSEQHEQLLIELQETLGVSNKADVIRKSLNIGNIIKEIKDNNQKIAIASSTGEIIEYIRII